MRKSIFTLILLALVSFVSAQSLQFEWNGTVYNSGDAVECDNDEFGYGEFIQHMQIRNLTSGDLNVIVESLIAVTATRADRSVLAIRNALPQGRLPVVAKRFVCYGSFKV